MTVLHKGAYAGTELKGTMEVTLYYFTYRGEVCSPSRLDVFFTNSTS